MAIQLGCALITWRRFPDFSPERALAEIARAGYAGAPVPFLPEWDTSHARAVFERVALKHAPGYYGGRFWRADLRGALLEDARRWAAFSTALGLTEMFVAPWVGDYATPRGDRKAVAGRLGGLAGARIQPDDLARFADALNAFGAATLAEGVRACFHNHAGSAIEHEEEVEALLAATDPALVFLGPDAGHLAFAGADPVAFARRHAGRILAAHVKDIDLGVRARGVAEGWDYDTFERNGVFTELGEGGVDVAGFVNALTSSGYSGWLIVETDTTRKPSAFDSALANRRFFLAR
jgi:inosose dehydratase